MLVIFANKTTKIKRIRYLSSAETVSYTHLDVYKRQVYSSALCCRLFPGPPPHHLSLYRSPSDICLLYTSRCV